MRWLLTILLLTIPCSLASARVHHGNQPTMLVDRHTPTGVVVTYPTWTAGVAAQRYVKKRHKKRYAHNKRKQETSHKKSQPSPMVSSSVNVAKPPVTQVASLGDLDATELSTVAEPVDLVAKAQRFLGTNPTGWARLWCAKFMCLIAPDLCRHVRNAALARSWAKDLPHVAPRVGAIAVLSRGRSRTAGHIGVVKGFDKNGNPILISGNHGRKVGTGTYPKYRVLAYVGPT